VSILLRILTALGLAATILVAGEEDADSVPLPRVQLFPAVALSPAEQAEGTTGGTLAGPEAETRRLAYAVWDELGTAIIEAASSGRTRRSGSPPGADLALVRPSLAPALSDGASAGPTRRIATGTDAPGAGRAMQLDLYSPAGLLTPEVEGVRGFLELHLVGEIGVSFGFAIDF